MNSETIDHTTLSHLIEAGSIRSATAVGQGDRWSLVVHYGSVDKTLQAKNSGQVRTWAKLDSLVKYLRNLGVRRFDTDATNYDPTQRSIHKRPDKSDALKRAHAAAKHDTWFRAEVQQGIDELAAGGQLIPHDQVFSDLDAALEKKYGKRTT